MAELKIYLSESLNEKFRRIAMIVYGYGRGSLSKAAAEALDRWCSEHGQPPSPEHGTEPAVSSGSKASGETVSHVDPDERENGSREVTIFKQDQSTNQVGDTT